MPLVLDINMKAVTLAWPTFGSGLFSLTAPVDAQHVFFFKNISVSKWD